MSRLLSLSLLLLCCCQFRPLVFSQGTKEDYQRAGQLQKLTQGKVFKSSVDPHWSGDKNHFWYLNQLRDQQREFVLVDVTSGIRLKAFDHGKLAAAITKVIQKPIAAEKLPIDWLEIDAEKKLLRFNAFDSAWQCDLSTYELTKIAPLKKPTPPKRRRRRRRGQQNRRPPQAKSPDGQWTAFIKNHNLYIRQEKNKKEIQLSLEGNQDDAYQEYFNWSPDSKKLVAVRRQKEQQHTVYVVESSPKDQLQPKLHSRQYLKPGDRIAINKPHLFDIATRKEVPVSDALFANPYQISETRWQKDSGRFTFLYNQRGHQVLRIVAVDANTGETAALIDEQSKTFIDYASKKFTHYLDDSHEIIWMSERDRWNHLYLYDSRTGQVKNQITRGPWVVRAIDRVDPEKRQIWFQASGLYPEQDPYYIHFCRIDFAGQKLVILTSGNGTHKIKYSPDGAYFIDTYSRVDMPPITELRRSDTGQMVCELERSDWSELLKTSWQIPERFTSKARDGKTDIYGVIFRPTNFDPKKKYPVIESIYAGPHGSFVPKRFSSYYRQQSLAELGFIVVKIDGLGTSNRSKDFHDVCWKNLGDSGFPDRILWIKAAAKKSPQMDISRIGIYGGSAGGQSSTRAMLAHGDFYKVAVSDCGCHDNRMDKIWWNELWMGWPVGPHYAEQSNVTNAHKLQGKLFLIVGELDTNVDPASTMQVVNALIKADKDFDLLVVPGGGHGIGGRYGIRRRRDFFVRHLLGVEPRR